MVVNTHQCNGNVVVNGNNVSGRVVMLTERQSGWQCSVVVMVAEACLSCSEGGLLSSLRINT